MSHLVLCLAMASLGGSIRADEEVLFFPTFAHLDKDKTHWIVPIHGWIFEPERDDALRRTGFSLLAERLGFKDGEERTERFTERAWPFLVDNERGKRIEVRIGEESFTLPASGANGHFRGTVRLKREVAEAAAGGKGDRWLAFRAVTRAGDARVFAGKAQMLNEEGLSVISDIDDTIKISEVADKPALLANTFLREYRPVKGMAERYDGWAKNGAAFHYVSDSPWQLFTPLTDFLKEHKFPEGTLHLKDFRWKDASFFDLFTDPMKRKTQTIEQVLEAFPQRRFILVGDSGEKDPEAYGDVARKHPKQIARILIRDLQGEGADAERYRRAFRDIPAEKCTLLPAK